jgi:chromate transporter
MSSHNLLMAEPPINNTNTSAITQRPRNKTELFLTFAAIALQGFGGVLTIIQREMVDKRRWLTQKEFTEDWAVSQILPGGNVVNLCIILGNRYFGWRGAMAALAGILLPPLVIVLILASLYNQFVDVPQVAGAVRGMGAAAAGLIGAVSLKMMAGLKKNELGPGISIGLIAMTFIAVGFLRWPLVYVVLGLGIPAMVYAIWALPRKEEAAP